MDELLNFADADFVRPHSSKIVGHLPWLFHFPIQPDYCLNELPKRKETTILAARTDSKLRNKRAGKGEEDERAEDKVVNTYIGEDNPKRQIEREIWSKWGGRKKGS